MAVAVSCLFFSAPKVGRKVWEIVVGTEKQELLRALLFLLGWTGPESKTISVYGKTGPYDSEIKGPQNGGAAVRRN